MFAIGVNVIDSKFEKKHFMTLQLAAVALRRWWWWSEEEECESRPKRK